MLPDYEFHIEQQPDLTWAIDACPAYGEPIRLPGLFATRNAAEAALARTRTRWFGTTTEGLRSVPA